MQVKGFININSLLSNVPGVISQLGELSPLSATFSLDKGFYQNTANLDYDLITFSVRDSAGNQTQLASSRVAFIFRVLDAVKQYYASRIPPYTPEALRAYVYPIIGSTLSTLEIGAIVNSNNINLPQWISFLQTDTGFSYNIWLSDSAFQQQYDEFTHVVVPPLLNVDSFFNQTSTIAGMLDNEDIDEYMVRVQEAKNNIPDTSTRVFKFNYIDPYDPSVTLETVWSVIVYGAAGDNIDAIKDSLMEYILTHSTRTRAQWEKIFPEIFRRTEMIIIPRWEDFAIPNMLTQTGIYSAMVQPNVVTEDLVNLIDFYDDSHVINNSVAIPSAYKSLLLMIVDGQNNIDGKKHFRELYSDYIPVSSTSMDFNRMSLPTQELIYRLEEMVIVAERMDTYSIIPDTIKRIKRNGIVYISSVLHGINFLMLPKYQLEKM